MDLSALGNLLVTVGILAKDIGKGGGGSPEEPTVCISLLPIALGVMFVGLQRLRRILSAPGGRTAAPDPGLLKARPERKVQTA